MYNGNLLFSRCTYQAKWVKTESTEQPTTSVLIARNSSIRSLKAMISVGQTKVLQNTERWKWFYKWKACVTRHGNCRNIYMYCTCSLLELSWSTMRVQSYFHILFILLSEVGALPSITISDADYCMMWSIAYPPNPPSPMGCWLNADQSHVFLWLTLFER